MKVRRKFLTFFMVLMLCVGMLPMPVFAASASQDGIEAALTTDKEEYCQGEDIVAVLAVTNTNEAAVSNVSLENLTPGGYRLADGAEAAKHVESMEAGETVVLTVTYAADGEENVSDSSNETEDEDNGDDAVNNFGDDNTPDSSNTASGGSNINSGSVPKTGDDSSITLWAALFVAACGGIAVVIALKKKSCRKLLSLFLCVAMAGALLPVSSVRAYAADVKNFSVSQDILVGEETVSLTATVTYDSFEMSETEQDTDGDGFSDFDEINLMGTDPSVPNDPEADTDGDGLTDGEEVNIYGTDINAADTDGDGLSDYDEVYIYHTDPAKADTDGDGLSDAFEIEHGLDPAKESSDGKTHDSEVPIQQEISDDGISLSLKDEGNIARPGISGTATGEMAENIFIAAAEDSTFKDNRALVGSAVYIDASDEYVSGLTLKFDVSEYENDIEELSICELNEDGTYELTESTLNGTELSCVLANSGTYFVMNIDSFLKGLGIDLDSYYAEDTAEDVMPETYFLDEGNYDNIPESLLKPDEETSDSMENECSVMSAEAYALETDMNEVAALAKENIALLSSNVSGQADIVFVIDTTGSMYDSISNVVTNVTAFATALSENYNVQINYGLIDFRDLEEDGAGTTKIIKNGSSEWFSDTSDFIAKVKSLKVDGGGDYNECDVDALETARRMDWRSSADKFVILITDAGYKVTNDYGISSMDEEVGLLAADGIITSVVTTMSCKSEYQSVYVTTGGIFANINEDFSMVLMSLADLIGEKTSDGTWVILKHGYRYVKLPELPVSESTSRDTDGDSLSDYKELGSPEIVDLSVWIAAQLALRGVPMSEYSGRRTITVYNAISDPASADTDDDGIIDSEDSAPWEKGLAGGIIGAVKICSYGTGPSSSGNFDGHAFIAYTSFVKDEFKLYGMQVDSYEQRADNYKYFKEKRPEYHTVNVVSNTVTTIGGWAEWLPDEMKGTWINNELVLYNKNGVPDDQRSLMKYITSAQLQKICLLSHDRSKWTVRYNCSAFAVDLWNGATGDNLSARGLLIFRNPASLSNNIEKRENFKVGDKLVAQWP